MNHQKRVVGLPKLEMLAQVRSKSGFVKGKWCDARVVEFSDSSVTLASVQPFKSGDPVQVSLALAMDVGQVAVDRINCRVEDSGLVSGEVVSRVLFSSEQDPFTTLGLERLRRLSAQYRRLNDRWANQELFKISAASRSQSVAIA